MGKKKHQPPSYIAALTAQLDALRRAVEQLSKPPPRPPAHSVLEDVSTPERWLQSALNAVMDASLVVDGIIGRRTRDTVRRFQQAAPRLSVGPLTVDGQAGPATIAALERLVGPRPAFSQVEFEEDAVAAELLRRHVVAGMRRHVVAGMRRLRQRLGRVGKQAESAALTWLDARMLRNRRELVREYWRRGEFHVVPDDTGKTGRAFVSKHAADLAAMKTAGGPLKVTRVRFAPADLDGPQTDVSVVGMLGGLGLVAIAALANFWGRSPKSSG